MRASGRPTGGGAGAGPQGGSTLGGARCEDQRSASPRADPGGRLRSVSHTSAHSRRAGSPCVWGVCRRGRVQPRPQGPCREQCPPTGWSALGRPPGAGPRPLAPSCRARTLGRSSVWVNAAGRPVEPTQAPCGESAASLEGAGAPRGGRPFPAGKGALGMPRPAEWSWTCSCLATESSHPGQQSPRSPQHLPGAHGEGPSR